MSPRTGASMGRSLRLLEPNTCYFITNRTARSCFFMRPSPQTNNELGAALARSASIHGVKVYAYVFASNHVHMIVSGNHETIPAFMRDFKSWSAKKVNRIIGWSGSFWQRRYSSEPILDDTALRGRYAYIIQHGVKEGLVERPELWPGLHCVEQLRTGAARTFQWFDAGGFFEAERAGDKPERSAFVHPVSLELAPPPFVSGGADNPGREVCDLIDAATREAAEVRGDAAYLGAEVVCQQDPLSRPLQTKRSRRPYCHASSREQRSAYRAKYRAFAEAFRKAVDSCRSGVSMPFPRYAFPPGGLASVAA